MQPGVQTLVGLGAVGDPLAPAPQEPKHPGGVVRLVALPDGLGELVDVLLGYRGLAGPEEGRGDSAATDRVTGPPGDLVGDLLVCHAAINHLT